MAFGSATLVNAQNVNIPDANFKAYLVGNSAINTNGDTSIQVSEASAFTGMIECNGLSITDLTGIEAFKSINTLNCSYNQLTSLDISANTALIFLNCQNNKLTVLDISANTALVGLLCGVNQLTSLDVSANTALSNLDCFHNQLTSLDVSANINLGSLYCSYNQLTTLDVSANTSLIFLDCSNNALTALDVSANTVLTRLLCSNNQLSTLNAKNGNNTKFTNFDAKSNPNLICIQVDDAAYSTTYWTNIDATASFSENCGLSVAENTLALASSIYPNPSNGSFTIALDKNYSQASVQVVDVLGKVVISTTLNHQTSTIDMKNAPKGVYFVKLLTSEGTQSITKVVIE